MDVDHAIDLTDTQRTTVLAMLKQHLPGTEAWVYGSRAKWTSTPQSDLDLVVFAKPEQRRQVGDLREAFDESTLPFRVDLFVWDEVSDSVRKRIESERVTLVDKLERGDHEDWRNTHWGELVTLEYGRALRDYHKAEGLFRVFGTNGPIGWHNKALTRGASVVVGRKGAYRGIHYSPDPCFVIDTAFYLQPKVEINIRWAYYTLMTHNINALDSGSAIPSTSRSDFYGLPVSVPPLSEQNAIAHILGTLDDKIELNRRVNETLEKMARALFKSWFIDFDPVRAKMAGSATGVPKQAIDLFPDGMVNSKLGDIPNGWPLTPLSEMMEFNPSRPLKKSQVAPYLPMASMPTSGHVPESVVERPFVSGMRFANGDTLLARITPCLENGKTALVDFLSDDEVGWGSTEYVVMTPLAPLPKEFAYCLARSQKFREFAIQNMSGTSGRQRVQAAALSGFSIPRPSGAVASEFGRVARSLLEQASTATNECRQLASIRDALLPKLISGDMRVETRDSSTDRNRSEGSDGERLPRSAS